MKTFKCIISLAICFGFTFNTYAVDTKMVKSNEYNPFLLKKYSLLFQPNKFPENMKAVIRSFYSSKTDQKYFQKILSEINLKQKISVTFNNSNEVLIARPGQKNILLSDFNFADSSLQINGALFQFINGESLESTLKRLTKSLAYNNKFSFFNIAVPDANATGVAGLIFSGLFVAIPIYILNSEFKAVENSLRLVLEKCQTNRELKTPYKDSETYSDFKRLSSDQAVVNISKMNAEPSCENWAIETIKNKSNRSGITRKVDLLSWCSLAKEIVKCNEEYIAGAPVTPHSDPISTTEIKGKSDSSAPETTKAPQGSKGAH
jgi:hypothetical protein